MDYGPSIKKDIKKMKVLHRGIDARGNKYKLVRTPDGGSMYIWDAGHVWADFTPARKPYIDTAHGNIGGK